MTEHRSSASLVPFLSEEWCERIEAAAADHPRGSGPPFTLEFHFTTPKASTVLHGHVRGERLESFGPCPCGTYDLQCEVSRGVALAIVKGEMTVAAAFFRGAMRPHGTIRAIRHAQSLLSSPAYRELLDAARTFTDLADETDSERAQILPRRR